MIDKYMMTRNLSKEFRSLVLAGFTNTMGDDVTRQYGAQQATQKYLEHFADFVMPASLYFIT